MGNLDDRTLGSFLLLVYILEIYEVVEDLHDELELVRNERIEVCEVFLRCVGIISGRQLELSLKRCLFFVVEFVEFHLASAVFLKETDLCDVLRSGVAKLDLNLETSHDFTVVVCGLANLAGRDNLAEGLLCSAGNPHLSLACVMETCYDFLELEEEFLVVVDELRYLIDKENKAEVRCFAFDVEGYLVLEFLDADDEVVFLQYAHGWSRLRGKEAVPVLSRGRG